MTRRVSAEPVYAAPRLYTTEQAAAQLAISPSFLRRGATAGVLPHTRVGRFIRWSDADLEQVVALGQRPVVASPLRRRSA